MRSAIVALTHALRGIVTLPKCAEQFSQWQAFWIKNDAHDLGMASFSTAHFFIGWIGRKTA
ncbi:Uncharacterised protein [Vibrio cholerae]|nr:Uncharacterised protein [Vibrio cholerae]CSD12327.1 Uncharacterised protein [Vibrio cholerae]